MYAVFIWGFFVVVGNEIGGVLFILFIRQSLKIKYLLIEILKKKCLL